MRLGLGSPRKCQLLDLSTVNRLASGTCMRLTWHGRSRGLLTQILVQAAGEAGSKGRYGAPQLHGTPRTLLIANAATRLPAAQLNLAPGHGPATDCDGFHLG